MWVPAKKAMTSWTLWFNFIGLIILGAEYLQTVDLPEFWEHVVMLVIILGNGILRFKTKQPVTVGGKGGKRIDSEHVA